VKRPGRLTVDAVHAYLVNAIARQSGVPSSVVEIHAPLAVYPMDSLGQATLVLQFSDWLGWRLEPQTVQHYPTIDELARYVVQADDEQHAGRTSGSSASSVVQHALQRASGMLKVFSLVPKKPGISDGQFLRHWRDVYAPMVLPIPGVRRYVQNHRLPQSVPGIPSPPYEGVSETWFDNLEAFSAAQRSEYREALRRDEPNFIDTTSDRIALFTRENVVLAGPEMAKDTPVVKLLGLAKRKPGMSVAEFQDYWRARHAPLVLRTPHLLRYVQGHVLPELYELSTPPAYDGVTELWWSDLAKFQEAWASPEMREQRNDACHLFDAGSTMMLVEEVRVIWPQPGGRG
jgi:uncharacterized protein (TIGR02118 family)